MDNNDVEMECPLRPIENIPEEMIAPSPAKKQKKSKEPKPSTSKQVKEIVDDLSDEDSEPENETIFIRRHKIRSKIFKLDEAVQKTYLQISYGKVDNDKISKIVTHYKKSDLINPENESIVTGHEIACDAVVGDELSKLLATTAGMINKEASKFNADEFAKKLKDVGLVNFYDNNCHDLFFHPKGFPSLCLLDPAAMPKADKKPKETVQRTGPKKKAEVVDIKGKQSDKIEKEEDTSLMEQLTVVKKSFKKILKTRDEEGINYYEFVIDPDDFGATIQNCFYVSFLLRDSSLYLEKHDGDEYPILRKLTKSESENLKKAENQGKPLPSHQCINTMTYSKWNELIKRLSIKQALIKAK